MLSTVSQSRNGLKQYYSGTYLNPDTTGLLSGCSFSHFYMCINIHHTHTHKRNDTHTPREGRMSSGPCGSAFVWQKNFMLSFSSLCLAFVDVNVSQLFLLHFCCIRSFYVFVFSLSLECLWTCVCYGLINEDIKHSLQTVVQLLSINCSTATQYKL